MKRLCFLALSMFLTQSSLAQPWIDNLDKKKLGEATFYDIQNSFYDYWESQEAEDRYYYGDGKKKKVGGWKQFKRWEWFWEIRVDPETGTFPDVSAFEVYKEYLRKKSTKQKSETIEWSNLGTSSSKSGYHGIGRINCVGFHPENDDIYWVGSPSGGLWKTTDGGKNWTVQNDDHTVIGVSDIAVVDDYSESQTLFIATGDRDAWDNRSVGVLRSTDGGDSWEESLSFTVKEGVLTTRLLLHPNDSTLYAATNKGVYKTIDRGDNWEQISWTGLIDMEFKPGNPEIMYGSTTSNTNISPAKIYKSTDAGENWTEIDNITGNRIELAVTADDPEIVYAVASNDQSGLEGIYRSEDGGDSYNKTYDNKNLLGWESDGSDSGGQGWYDLTIAADPNFADTVYVGGVNTWLSEDGGDSWEIVNHWWGDRAPAVHADKHCMEFRNGTSELFEGNDGGIYKTDDFGSTWEDYTDGMVISQIYRSASAQTDSNVVLNGLQDNGTKLYHKGKWYDVQGGDGMDCMIDYTDVNTQYGTLPNGAIRRTTDLWENSKTIISTDTITGAWVTPIEMHPEDHSTLFAGYSDLLKSTDQGNNWERISDIDIADKIRAIAIAESDPNTIYLAGRNEIWKTTDGGEAWEQIDNNDLPLSSNKIVSVTVKHDDPNTVWVSLGNYNNQNVYESVDGGESWSDISAGLPELPALDIVENKYNTWSTELFLGMDVGVYRKVGDNDWEPFNTGLPNVVVNDLDIYYDEVEPDNSRIFAATYGRGLWEARLPLSGMVANPSEIKTFVYPESIDIDWKVNTDNDSVLLAWSDTDSFGEPDSAVEYNEGDRIKDGGEVLYFDDTQSEYTHHSLETNTNYYYKLWSFNGERYSPGTMLESTTSCYAPSEQATDLVFSKVTDSSITAKWMRGTGDNVIVIVKEGSSGEGLPVSGIGYKADNVFGEGSNVDDDYFVVYNDDGDSVVVEGLNRKTGYNFKVLEYKIQDSCYLEPALTGNIYTKQTTGIDKELESQIKIYPNPVKNMLVIENNGFSNAVDIRIMDISGKLVYDQAARSFDKTTINMKAFDPGVYIIQIGGKAGVIQRKIVVGK
ncbi:MAG: T9SS type A sorting domain-containing protein [Bacteroidales bacterium]